MAGHGIGRRLLAGLLLLNALALAWMALDLSGSRQNHEEQARLASRNMALALDQNVSASAEKIDLVLLTAVDFLQDRLRAGQPLLGPEIKACCGVSMSGRRTRPAGPIVIFSPACKRVRRAAC